VSGMRRQAAAAADGHVLLAPTRWIRNTSSLETGEILASRVFPLGMTRGNSMRPTSGGHIARSAHYAQVDRAPVLPLIQRSLSEELFHSNGGVDRPVQSALDRNVRYVSPSGAE
jgi:hypothetical protein